MSVLPKKLGQSAVEYFCQTCGKPATHARISLQEREPMVDEDPRWRYVTRRPLTLGCDEHPV